MANSWWRFGAGLLLVLGVALGGCGDDDGTEQTGDTIEDVAEDVGDAANDAWASFRTGAERLIDEASTGDSEAQDQLLDDCRDTLEDMRQDDDPDADRVQSICDEIRDADDEEAWDDLRQEIEEIDEGR